MCKNDDVSLSPKRESSIHPVRGMFACVCVCMCASTKPNKIELGKRIRAICVIHDPQISSIKPYAYFDLVWPLLRVAVAITIRSSRYCSAIHSSLKFVLNAPTEHSPISMMTLFHVYLLHPSLHLNGHMI